MKTFFSNLFKGSSNSFTVGSRIYSHNTKRVLYLKREIYVNDIRHFSASLEGGHKQRPLLLSEFALKDSRCEIINTEEKIDHIS